MSKFNNLFTYMGSKIKILPHLINDKILPEKGDILVEPFMGSCALLLNTDYNKYYMNDLNKYIYDFTNILLTIDLEQLDANYNKLLEKFHYTGTDEAIKQEKKDFFYKVRGMYFDNYDKLDDLKKASLFCFLSYNGFSCKPINTSLSCGQIDIKKPLRMDVYKAFQAKKDKIVLANLDYKYFIKEVLKYEKEEDITLYLDPLYVDSFKYQKGNDLDGFVNDIKKLYTEHDFLITIQSNFKNAEVMRLYKDYNIIEVDRKLNVQAGSEDTKTKTEVIIVKDDRYHPTRQFELNILINWLTLKDYDPKIIQHYKRELKNVK